MSHILNGGSYFFMFTASTLAQKYLLFWAIIEALRDASGSFFYFITGLFASISLFILQETFSFYFDF